MEKRTGVNSIVLHWKIQQMIKTWRKRVKKSRHRVNILKEWELTEQSYIKDLQLIIEKIQKPLVDAEVISQDEDRTLFPNLNSMLKLSEEMLNDIRGFLKEWNPHHTLIGEKIINFHKYFIIYREYCNNFYKGQAILKEVKKNPKYEKIQSGLMMDIESYIIKPVQRPPKYQLLLREYLKALPPNHKDEKFLTMAIEKYHDVNEENNQSMDLQIRNERMIELDKKYGGIISPARIYLAQEIAKSIDFKVKLLIFNDLILVLKIHNEGHEEGFKKVFLDGQSFIEAPMDGKYFLNKIFICGTKENLHLNFMTVADRDRIYEMIKKLIGNLYRKQYDRVSIRKKGKAKMNVLAFQDLEIKGRPMLRVIVMGVEKRPAFASHETYYILKIQAPNPNIQFQYCYLRWEELIALEKQIKGKNKFLSLPILDEHPDTMSYYDIKKNKTKIIEYRQIYIERFINYVFRSEEFDHYLPMFAQALKINEAFWSFLNYHEPCSCDICINNYQMTVSQLETQKSQVQSEIYTRNSFSNRMSEVSEKSQFFEGNCLFNSFIIPNKIVNSTVQELDTLSRRLMWLDSEMGRIDYSMLPKTQQPKTLKIGIQILSLKEDEGITVLINEHTTVQEVIEQIGANYRLESMRDFGIFLEYQEIPRLVDRDEKLWEALKQAEYEVEEEKQKEKSQSQGGFWKRLNSLKRWGSEILGSKKSRLFIRKYLFVQDQLEIAACESNPQRYSLLAEQVFYRFKNQILILSVNDTKRLCALYYILNTMQKLAHLCETNFRVEKLKPLMPESKWHLLNDSIIFGKDVYLHIEEYQDRMERSPSKTKSETIFSKVEIIYDCVLSLVNSSLGWNTLFFEVTNYDPPSLPGNIPELLLGINRKNLVIIRHKQLTPLVEISLKSLSYKVTVFSIFIDTKERVLRFDGRMMYDIKKLIEMYKHLSQKFDN